MSGVDTEIYTYVDLRGVAKLLIASERRRKYGNYECAMGVIVFTTFFVEAYLNYVGSLILPAWSPEYERRTTLLKKLSTIAIHLGYGLDHSSAEYSSIVALIRCRDALAHGKLEKLRSKNIPRRMRSSSMVFLETEWQQATQNGRFRKYFTDAKNLITRLHELHAPGRKPFSISASSTW